MKKDLQEIELTIKDIEDGIFAVSLVSKPAIEENFVALSEHEIELKVIDEDKRIVVGYALIPDKRIYRRVEDKEFNIFFTADTVKLASEMYMKQLNLNNVTVEHEKKVSDVGIIESWITEDKKHDKVNLYGITPIVGGWAIMMKVNNDSEWAKVKDGSYRGFSIEGKFAGFENLMSKNNKMDIVEEIKALINAELKSESVELGFAEDYVKDIDNTYNKALQNVDSKRKEYHNFVNSQIKLLSDLNQRALNDLMEFEKKANDLGIDPKTTKPYKLYSDANKKLLQQIKFLDDKYQIGLA